MKFQFALSYKPSIKNGVIEYKEKYPDNKKYFEIPHVVKIW